MNHSDEEAYIALDVSTETVKGKKKDYPTLDEKIRDWMCANFYDIRAFGAVMTTFQTAKLNCGQVRGPVQLGFAQSIEPINTMPISIARITQATQKDLEEKGTNTFGDKYIIPYGLYRCEGYVSANLARKTTGFSEEDLELLWQAILNMFENDHSASALESVGLDSYVGFLHRDRPGRTSLALDLMEELRACMADRFVLTLINNRQVKASDFLYMESGAVLLTDEGRKIFLKDWQEKKKEVLTHPYWGENFLGE